MNTSAMFARLIVVCCAATGPALPLSGHAMSNPATPALVVEQDWARDAVRDGEIRPLTEVLKRVERDFSGRIVQIELNRQSDQLIYQIELMSTQGHIVELLYDARTAVLISANGRDVDSLRRQR